MSKIRFTDQQWAFIEPLLPPPAHTGRPRANDRRTVEGILYVLITGCRWQDLPHDFGAPTTVWRRLKRWGEDGVWERIWHAALSAPVILRAILHHEMTAKAHHAITAKAHHMADRRE
jgi:transposase